jgi:acyl carrier protein
VEPRELEVESVRSVVLRTFADTKKLETAVVADGDDPFAVYALDSLQIFAVISRLERAFDIVIGESLSEFDRIRTFVGLTDLILEKTNAPRGESEAP